MELCRTKVEIDRKRRWGRKRRVRARDWGEVDRAGSRDQVTHIGRNDQLFVTRMM